MRKGSSPAVDLEPKALRRDVGLNRWTPDHVVARVRELERVAGARRRVDGRLRHGGPVGGWMYWPFDWVRNVRDDREPKLSSRLQPPYEAGRLWLTRRSGRARRAGGSARTTSMTRCRPHRRRQPRSAWSAPSYPPMSRRHRSRQSQLPPPRGSAVVPLSVSRDLPTRARHDSMLATCARSPALDARRLYGVAVTCARGGALESVLRYQPLDSSVSLRSKTSCIGLLPAHSRKTVGGAVGRMPSNAGWLARPRRSAPARPSSVVSIFSTTRGHRLAEVRPWPTPNSTLYRNGSLGLPAPAPLRHRAGDEARSIKAEIAPRESPIQEARQAVRGCSSRRQRPGLLRSRVSRAFAG